METTALLNAATEFTAAADVSAEQASKAITELATFELALVGGGTANVALW
jgi:hypothetical protein